MVKFEDSYDAIVIGAGPAGSYVSYCLGRNNLRVLLLEKSEFPRHKVCGSCLNQVALKELRKIELFDQSLLDKAPAISKLNLALPGIEKTFSIPEGVAISRSKLDFELTKAAQEVGVEFCTSVSATVGSANSSYRNVLVYKDNQDYELRAKLVIVADGLGGQSLSKLEEFGSKEKPNSLIGVGSVIDSYPKSYKTGTIYMAIGTDGYVGTVVLESGELDIAAALNPQKVKEVGGPTNLCKSILESCGFTTLNQFEKLKFKGTIPLTRHRANIAGSRLFVIGDAASYVEPFTGEGIAWSLISAKAVSSIAIKSVRQAEWNNLAEVEWITTHKNLVNSKQTAAKFFSWILRHPNLFRPFVATMDNNPWMIDRVSGYINST